MPDRSRVLVTGSQGFIGQALSHSLQAAGYDVWGVDRLASRSDRVVAADLMDERATCEAIESVPRFDTLIHAAALTHGRRSAAGESCLGCNTRLTENVLQAIHKRAPRMIFLSSVSVYGEYGRRGPVAVGDELRPATDYGKSKALCEQRIMASDIEHCDILRLAPVYGEAHLDNVRKRVFLPGFPRVKIQLHPSPKYSLCHLDTVVKTVLDLLGRAAAGHRIIHVADPQPYDQNELASRFTGVSVPLPANLLRPISWSSFLLPRRYGYPLRCLCSKLFSSNVYTTVAMEEAAPPAETRIQGRARFYAC